MTTHGDIKPGPACPARHGNGADVSVADFVLVVDDCENGPDRKPTLTEIFAFFSAPGKPHDNDDAVHTAGLTVPISSPVAQLARHVGADPHGPLARKVGDVLRQNVARCPCTATSECPALDEIRLFEAMERARS
jgi:hypothetical protein